ncbi:MAG: hypothetical protein FD122_1138 [Stygiobacter sp.]|nr:MAG: hypothetical protein FD122_1138 [Stygiobacter sp.]KAF0215107.1 MAG: hypothetical protein FD178_1933 [Ignavibacteria bacterium]
MIMDLMSNQIHPIVNCFIPSQKGLNKYCVHYSIKMSLPTELKIP